MSLDLASNISYLSGLVDTPASGAPGAYAKLLADATATADWWVAAVMAGNLSGAGATVFNYQIARIEDGSGTDIANTLNILLEAATAAIQMQILLPWPVRVAAGVGAAGRQTTASGKTLDICLLYAVGIGT